MKPLKSFIGNLAVDESSIMSKPSTTIYDIEINDLKGQPLNLEDFRGKKMLFVNVASKCGFTPQYKELQELQDTYKNKLIVIGVPCNQFGAQEPGSAQDIEKFCQINYGVTFPITEKIDVKGTNAHPLYKWLTTKTRNGEKSTVVKWNFQKYLVDEQGQWIDYFYSITKPTSKRITKYLN